MAGVAYGGEKTEQTNQNHSEWEYHLQQSHVGRGLRGHEYVFVWSQTPST
jgi:hypothetical protein